MFDTGCKQSVDEFVEETGAGLLKGGVRTPRMGSLRIPVGERIKHLVVLGERRPAVYANVYYVRDEDKDAKYVLKAATGKDSINRLRAELYVLECAKAEGAKHFRDVVYKDTHPITPRISSHNYIVVEPYGRSLADLRKTLNVNFTKSTALQIGRQTLAALSELHELGFVHRDVRPENFAVGVGEKNNVIYAVDLMRAKRYNSEETARPRRFRKFAGTIRWAPRANHRCVDQGRKDDMESWLYLLVDCLDDSALSWTHFETARAREGVRWEALCAKELLFEWTTKRTDTRVASLHSRFFRHIPRCIVKLFRHVDALSFSDQPDYELIEQVLMEMAEKSKADMGAPLDWAKEPDAPFDCIHAGSAEKSVLGDTQAWGVAEETEREKKKEQETEREQESSQQTKKAAETTTQAEDENSIQAKKKGADATQAEEEKEQSLQSKRCKEDSEQEKKGGEQNEKKWTEEAPEQSWQSRREKSEQEKKDGEKKQKKEEEQSAQKKKTGEKKVSERTKKGVHRLETDGDSETDEKEMERKKDKGNEKKQKCVKEEQEKSQQKKKIPEQERKGKDKKQKKEEQEQSAQKKKEIEKKMSEKKMSEKKKKGFHWFEMEEESEEEDKEQEKTRSSQRKQVKEKRQTAGKDKKTEKTADSVDKNEKKGGKGEKAGDTVDKKTAKTPDKSSNSGDTPEKSKKEEAKKRERHKKEAPNDGDSTARPLRARLEGREAFLHYAAFCDARQSLPKDVFKQCADRRFTLKKC